MEKGLSNINFRDGGERISENVHFIHIRPLREPAAKLAQVFLTYSSSAFAVFVGTPTQQRYPPCYTHSVPESGNATIAMEDKERQQQHPSYRRRTL